MGWMRRSGWCFKTLRRSQVLAFFAKLEPSVVGLEACVAPLGPRAQRPGPRGEADRPAACEAAASNATRTTRATPRAGAQATGRPSMEYVPVKTAGQQAALMLMGMRERLIKTRTQSGNAGPRPCGGVRAGRAHRAGQDRAAGLRASPPTRACRRWPAGCSEATPDFAGDLRCRPVSTPSCKGGSRISRPG